MRDWQYDMMKSNMLFGIPVLRLILFVFLPLSMFAQGGVLKGRVTDPQGDVLPNASVQLVGHDSLERDRLLTQTTSRPDGRFELKVDSVGSFDIKVSAEGFRPLTRQVTVRSGNNPEIVISMSQLSTRTENVRVTADINETDVISPDPGEKVFVRQDLLDATPARPAAPVSIPGYPIETASSGIKAPQYFAPGVAGDHGEPIATFIQAGSFLMPNNLSANAHGNGYSDPNIMVPAIIESVRTDGGAFNVREGNHSVDLAAIYAIRSSLEPFATFTADYRDVDLNAGWKWLAVQASFGNGFLDTLEHRQQYKI